MVYAYCTPGGDFFQSLPVSYFCHSLHDILKQKDGPLFWAAGRRKGEREMDKILFVNACVRKDSRTRQLAQTVLECLDGEIEEVNLNSHKVMPLGRAALSQRDSDLQKGWVGSPAFELARQFAQADEIVIAAPFWDLFFPAVLKAYLENICVAGVTFQYHNGTPRGLCRAKRLIYVTTSGGYIKTDYGFRYLDALCKTFFEIPDTCAFRCQGLDIYGSNVEKLLADTKAQIRQALRKK